MYRWPVEGWIRGTVTGHSRAAGFSHVVRYGRAFALGSALVPSDAARRCLALPGWLLGASATRFSLVWLLFSETAFMGLPTGGARLG